MITKDIRYAIRLLAKNPGFTLLTTLVMAVGIGLSVYMFSVLNTVFYKDLPFKDGESLVNMFTSQNGNRTFGRLDLHDLYEIRTQVKGLSEISAFSPTSVNVTGRDGARRYEAAISEANVFQMMRTKPILGREFTRAEMQVGAEPVTVISYDIWRNQFNGDPAVLDQTLRINGVTRRIIGVMPEDYHLPGNVDVWFPMEQEATRIARGEGYDIRVFAHIDDGYSIEDINNQLTLIMQRLEEKYPTSNSGVGAFIQRFQGDPNGVIINSMNLSAILILILASLNVGNLLFSRAIERGKETAIRAALGAPRSRLISQMIWESVIICSVGGVVGLLAIVWGLEVTQTYFETMSAPNRLPPWMVFGLDAFTIKLSLFFIVFTVLVTGVWPAWKNSAEDFNVVLRDGTRGALGKKAGRLSRLLVISEIFISITVLITAGLLIVTQYKIANVDVGADTQNKLIATVRMLGPNYDSPEKKTQFAKILQSRLENSGGIGDVMLVSGFPGQGTPRPAFALEGKEYTKEGGYPRVNSIVLTPGSLAKLGVGLKEGRYFNNSDEGLGRKTIIVTDSFARRHFPNESALGKRIRMVEDDEPAWLTIVGVVKHTVQGGAVGESATRGSMFRPFSQAPGVELYTIMQMKAERSVVINTLRSKLASIDSDLPAFEIQTYTEILSRYNTGMKFVSTVFLLFGIATVLLAASGIYGVMSNTINQRTQEIGVKRALGAMERRITKEYLVIGLKQLLWGGLPGFLIGCGMGFAMSSNLGVTTVDMLIVSLPVMFVIASVVIFSAWMPTQRALRIGPSEALRYE